jgi:NDP-sugar pyrophosphorylase family protein
MKIIIPMAGSGNRFIQKGYDLPKPLIFVNKKRIIEYILESYEKDDEIIFICNEEHLQKTNMRKILLSLRPNARIVAIPSHKLGPVYSLKAVYEFIDDEEEIIVSYCDNPFIWNYNDFKFYIKKNSLDGCIVTHTGFHPHSLNSTKMAFLKVKDELLLEIKEKECYTDNHLNEHASTGAYYFNKGKYIKKYCDELLKNNINYNGEFYVTLVYNLLIKDSLRVGFYDTPFVTVFGTPEEVESFEAWNTLLKSGQVKSLEDLKKCYEYWSEYHDRKQKNNFC